MDIITESDKQNELEASVFAMELLMPLKLLQNELTAGESIDSKRLVQLSKLFGVDETIMQFRLMSLNMRKDINVTFAY